MSIELTWKVEVGPVASPNDLTSYVRGLQIKQSVGYMKPSYQTAVITLNNFDGDFTPGAGNTYSNVDWFKQGVFISCEVNSYGLVPQVFHGILDDIEFSEDKTDPVVTITAVDWLTVGARALSGYQFTYAGDIRWTTAANGTIQQFLRGTSAPAAATLFQLPALGQDYGDVVADTEPGGKVRTDISYIEVLPEIFIGDSLGDYLTSLLAGVPGALYATYITEDLDGSSNPIAFYEWDIIGETLTRNVVREFEFSEEAADTLTANQLPIAEITRGFDIDRLINQVELKSADTGNTETVTDQTSVDNYGVRTYRSNESQIVQDVMLEAAATNIVNRSSTTRFMTRRLSFDSAQLALLTSSSEIDVAYLLDVSLGLWAPATVTFTPLGAASQTTEQVVISGRTISAVPGRTTIDLELLPAADYQSFVLDSDVLGVLDQNRLG